MLLLQCRKGASFPKLYNLVPNGKMKILLVFLGLFGSSAAMPMYMPRMPGFSSKSEEMMRYGQFNYMHPPPMGPMGPYGNGYQIPPPYPQYPMPPMWPQPLPSGWQNPPGPQHQTKTDPTQETQKPNQTQPQKPPEKQPLNQPPQDPPKGKADTQPPQPFPPFNNGLFPFQQPPWPIPQRMPPPGYGRPPLSNEDGGNPYFGFFGYPGFGGRPYYSEEMFEDYEKPKEEDPPKPEDPPSEPSANSTVPETNSTQPGIQGKNDTSPTLTNVPGLNTGNNPTAPNGIFPLPTVNFSGQVVPRNQIPWKPSQPNIYGIYPKPNIRNSPSGRQSNPTGTATGRRQSGPSYRNQPGQRGPQGNSFAWEGKQAVGPQNPTYRKAYTPTSRVNYPNYAGNPANFRRKLQGPNKPFVGTNVTPMSPKLGTVGRSEKTQNPKEKSPSQKERTVSPTKDTSGSWRNSQHYRVNKPNYGWPRPEGNMPEPNFNSVNQHENSYYSRGETRRVTNSNTQTQSQNFPKGIALEPKRIPYETQTKQPELKHSTHPPLYPDIIPSPKREHFPAGRSTWSHQEIPPPFKEDPGKQDKHLPRLPPGSGGSVFHHEYNPYYPRENSPYTGSNTWGKRVDPPNTMGQPKIPQYPLKSADKKETVKYNEEDPPDPTGDEPFPGRSRWGEEEFSFNGRPLIRHYDGEQYTSNLPKEYLPYSLDNPSKPREESPYSEFYPWSLDETFPSNSPSPTVSPPEESRGYYVNNAVQQEESTFFPSWNSWDNRIPAQGQQESEPYSNRNYWEQATNVQEVSLPNQKENYPYSSNPSVGLQNNPTWHEGENLNYDVQITRLNSPERQHLSFLDLMPQSYPSGHTEAHLFHQGPRGSCCIGSSAGPHENPLALQVYTPAYSLLPGDNPNTNPTYTESSHTKHVRPVVSPVSILPGQRNSSEKKLPGESQRPSTFRDDVSTLKDTPCSVKNQRDQVGIRSFPEASSPQSKNTPCLKNDLGGDGKNVLEQILEGNRLKERTVDLTPEQLVIGTTDASPKPQEIQKETQRKEGERQQERPPSILQVPCFGSQLTKLQSSNTGTPSSNGRQGPSDGELTMPTENPNTFVALATREPFRSISVDQLNADEHTPFESFQRGTDPQDCLLIQA
ncbi:PREDICTED: enamelin [Chinchilla lanigera]|uniref:enamelin n=1 Tax=Chinchilla lanigera TaxID=34839 RepID=UPI0006988D4A|nr:PREDICTED: enamelin [Chinchilla lanigera]